MSAENLVVVSGILLTLGFSYFPKLRELYAKQDPNIQRLIMLGLLVLVAVGSFGLACAQLATDFLINVTCDQPGAVGLIKALVEAIIANQAIYLISPKPKSVREAKEGRTLRLKRNR